MRYWRDPVSTTGLAHTEVLVLLVHRRFDWRRIYPLLVNTLSLTGAAMPIIGAATAKPRYLAAARLGFLSVPAIVLFGALPFPVARAMDVHDDALWRWRSWWRCPACRSGSCRARSVFDILSVLC